MPGIVRIRQDGIVEHCNPFGVCHKTNYATGSPNVKVNGSYVVRVGDMTECGDIALTGSPNVKVNGIPIHRKGDATEGHDGFAPTIAETGSSNVFANGR